MKSATKFTNFSAKTHLLTCVFLQCFAFLLFSLSANAQTCSPAQVGLISWWSADGNALDSRSRNNGTLLNGANFSAGNVGQAFNFDGVNDSVQVSHDANQNINGSFSAETWIFPRSVNNNSPRILEKSDGSNRWLLAINQSSPANSLELIINPSQVILFSPANSIVLNQWSHVAFTYNSVTNDVKLFINGTQVAATTTTAITTTSTNPLVIGNDFLTGTRPFDGLIDEPAIYDTALSVNQIQAIFNSGTAGKCKPTATVSPSGQVGWWSGDGNANDIAGTSNGTLNGGAGFAVGKVGQTFSFDGIDDNVSVGNPASLQTQDFTIEAWIKRASSSIISNNGSSGNIFAYGQDGYAIGILQSTNQLFLSKVGVSSAFSTTTITDTNYHHVAVTQSAGTTTLYIDGVADAPVSYNPGFTFTTTASIGTSVIAGGNGFFFGNIDEVSVYNRGLTTAEVTSIFNAGIAGKLKDNSTATGSNVAVTTKSDATVTFPTVSTAGITQQIPLDLSLFPSLPIGSTTSGLTADIATTATFTGSPQVCFNLPSVTTSLAFNNLRILHLESNAWINRTNLASINFATRTICTNSGLPSLSPFAIVNGFAPTAAESTISGRVTTASGRGIRNAVVQIFGGNLGETRYIRTNPFGYYRISGLDSGQTYILNVASKQYSFTNPTRVITLNEDLTGEDFVSESK
jgi:hypothetical protein